MHACRYLAKLVHFLKARLQVDEVVHESPTAFLHKLDNEEEDFSKPMKFVSDRLRSLLRTLEVTDVQDFSPLMLIADFATLVATFQKGFGIIIEPYDERTPALRDPLFQLCCNDASIAIKPVFERFQSVVITSGTLSPLDMYKKILEVGSSSPPFPSHHGSLPTAPRACSLHTGRAPHSCAPFSSVHMSCARALPALLCVRVCVSAYACVAGGAGGGAVLPNVLCARRHPATRRDTWRRPDRALFQVRHAL